MLANCDATSDKTDSHTQNQCHRDQIMENLVHAKELHHIADKAELIADVTLQSSRNNAVQNASGIAAPISPITIPSTTNGARTK